MSSEEQVLCFLEQDLREFFDFSFSKGAHKSIYSPFHLLEEVDFFFRPRSLVENDPNYKQLIPYVIFKTKSSTYLTYRRGGGVGESRLAGKLSIGIGGHVNNTTGGEFDYQSFIKEMYREIEEEIGNPQDVIKVLNFLGWIYDDSNDVGKVHLGAAYLADLPDELDGKTLELNDPELYFEDFLSVDELKSIKLQLETWSVLALDLL